MTISLLSHIYHGYIGSPADTMFKNFLVTPLAGDNLLAVYKKY